VTPERYKQVRDLASSVLDRPEAERRAYLAAACAGDETLRAEVSSLLAAEREVQGLPFLDDLAAAAVLGHAGTGPTTDAGALETLPSGSRIGAYEIVDVIGRGGMGVVYRAVRADEAYRQVVAVKVIRRGMETPAAQRRFREERQILAALEHPGIARLLDGGTTEDGLPYLVMELVPGEPIDAYCDSRRLGVPERLWLFLKICEAVHHAHRSLVVHRDLKPGNILVTPDGVPKLLDFGIARLLPPPDAETPVERTVTALRALTPNYASPEQVRGVSVTTSTDVYSLGVVLYELLAGSRPHEGGLAHEVLAAICDEDPDRPSASVARTRVRTSGSGTVELTPEAVSGSRGLSPKLLRRRLAGDLDTIVLKALRKVPTERYASVEALAEDLRRHLEGRPVRARPQTAGYRAGKFVRRNPGLVVASALAVAALLGGIVATTRQTRLAQRRFDEARRLIRTVIFDVQPKMAAVPGTTPLRKELIESTLQYLEALARDAGNNPALLRELSASYVQLARVQGMRGEANVGDVQGARRTLGEAEKLTHRLLTLDPRGPESLHEAVLVERALALSSLEEGANPRAQQHARRAVELAERLAGIRPDFQARQDLADAHRTLGNCSDSLEAFARSREISESLLLEKPDEPRVLRSMSDAYKYAAGLHYRKDEYRIGLDLIAKARVIDEKLLAATPENPQAQVDLVFALNQLSWGHSNLGDVTTALAAQQQSLALQEKIVAGNPGEARAQDRLAFALRAMGRLRRQMSDPAGARPYFQRAHAIYTALRARGYGGANVASNLGVTELNLGDVAAEQGQEAEACRWYRRSAAVYGELAARDAVLPNHKIDAERARLKAAACGG
jgi:eukaryotic-like serine/threonine-protein kinase